MKLKYYGTGAGYGLPEVLCDCRHVDRTHEELGAEAAIVAWDGMEIEF